MFSSSETASDHIIETWATAIGIARSKQRQSPIQLIATFLSGEPIDGMTYLHGSEDSN